MDGRQKPPGPAVPEFAVLSAPAGLAVRLSHHAESLPAEPLFQFNVWGRPRDGYLSPEPIVGLQNSLNLRQGLIELPAGRTWSWWLWIDLERMPLH